jgi:hypothetical protein
MGYQFMSENRAEQLRDRVQEEAQRKRQEYERLMILLEKRVEEINANRGDLPEIVVRSSSLQLDQFKLYIEFDQLFPKLTDYVLVLRVGQERKPLFGSDLPAVRHRLQPIVADDLRSIVWMGNVGDITQFNTAELVELALDMLTGYYRRHRPK